MLKISDAVETALRQDDIALQAMEYGVLNLSAYAAKILPKVEAATFKPVKKGTIVVALARLEKQIRGVTTIRPHIQLDDLTIKSPLCDISFVKTPHARQKLTELYQKIQLSESAFFAVTQSMTEITIVAPQSLQNVMLEHFSETPKAIFSDQVAVTVKFSDEYLSVPNVLYTLQSALAVHHINFTEIISTYTEFSVIIDQKYLADATSALKQFFK